MNNNQITILINGVGGPTPRALARSIKRYGKYKDATLIGTDIDPYAYGLYENDLYDQTYVIPPAGQEGYWETIEAIIQKHNIDLAMVQPEKEILEWAKRKKATNDLPCKALLPDYEMAKLLVDKSLMTDVLKDTGMVPSSLNMDPENPDFEEIEEKLGYPFWMRATSGSSGLGSLKVTNRNALKNWITINPGVKQFIGSTYLPGRNLACKMLYHNGQLLRAASAERVNYIMSNVAPSGITGNTSFGRLLNEPDLVTKTDQVLQKLFSYTDTQLHGFFTADYKEDENGTPYITEVNVRMVAFNLAFAAGGAHFGEAIISLINEDPELNHTYHMYEFPPGLIFLRDVDAEPILMKEGELKKQFRG